MKLVGCYYIFVPVNRHTTTWWPTIGRQNFQMLISRLLVVNLNETWYWNSIAYILLSSLLSSMMSWQILTAAPVPDKQSNACILTCNGHIWMEIVMKLYYHTIYKLLLSMALLTFDGRQSEPTISGYNLVLSRFQASPSCIFLLQNSLVYVCVPPCYLETWFLRF